MKNGGFGRFVNKNLTPNLSNFEENMSDHREKDRVRRDMKPRESSTARKPIRAESMDRRPIITQEKPSKSERNLREKGKSQTTDQKRRPFVDSKKDKTNSEKDRKVKQSGPVKVKRHESGDSIVDKTKEKKVVRKSETEKSAKKGVEGSKNKVDGEEDRSRVWRNRTRTRTLSPTEIKQLLPAKMADVSTAGNSNENKEIDKREEDEEYEDDFEDYDSDFEEDTESEKSPPRAQTPIENQWKLHIQKTEIEAVKKSMEIENYGGKISDGGDSDKENIPDQKPTTGIIDFSAASKKQKRTREAAASRKRGEQLLAMISLDTISYSILEIPPIAYDEFMKTFGKSNTKQVYVQTNEDNLDEEVQTDDVLFTNKWTQNPPEYLGSLKTGSFVLTKEERLGVGGDEPLEDEVVIQPNTKALWNFLSWASQLMLTALEKKSGNFLSWENMPNHSKAMAFGDGFVSLNVSDIPFLKGRSVTNLCLLSKSFGKLLSVHINKEKSFQKCMICVWSLRELSKPVKVLLASNRVTTCCFGLNQGNLVFAGLSDGSVCLWDLRESSAFHNQTTHSPEWILQSSTYTTAGNLRDVGHTSPVVAVRLLGKTEGVSAFGDFTPMQICSLDKDGLIIIWTVVQLEKAQRNIPSDDLGLAHWGRVKLVKSSLFSVFDRLGEEIPGFYITCNDFLINEAEDDGFYVANSLGSVHHCSSYGFPMKPKFYLPSKQDAIVEATCLELCPFNGNYFLVGCSDGTVRLHSRQQENPLICLNANVIENEKEAPVVSLSWMRVRPCVFFALDSMSRINIWDLGISDIYPEISLVLTEKRITCMRLLSISDPRQPPFIVIGTEGGSIEIHKLKKEYGCRSVSDVQNEMKMFLKYVSIL